MKKARQITAALRPQHLNLETGHCRRRTWPLAAVLCLLAGALTLMSPAVARAQSGTWTADSDGNWSDTTKWAGGTVADGATNTATFNMNITGNRSVTLDSSRTIGTVLFGDTSGSSLWTLRTLNSSVLTMDNGTDKPKIRAIQGGNGFRCNIVIVGTNGYRGPDTASGVLALGAASSYTGDTEIGRNIIKLNVANAIPSGAGYGNVVMLANYGNPGDTSKLDLNTFSPTINGLSSIFDPVAYPNYNNAPYVYSTAGAGSSLTLTVGAGDANGEFGGIIRNGTSRTLALTKIGAGTQSLTNANTYSGATIVSGGTLKLRFGGSIADSASITLGAGTTFDVGDVTTPPYQLGGSQTLNGSGGTSTINGDLALGSGPLLLTYVASTPTITVLSNLALNGNPITVSVVGTFLGDGNYKLISKSGSGVVSGSTGSLTVDGLGIAGGGTPSLSISGDELYLNISGGATAVEWGSGNGTWAVGVSGWNSGGGTAFADGYAALFTDSYSTGNPTITLNTEVLPQGVIVFSTNSYTISGTGDIGGTAELRKMGPGSLTLDVANTHTGGSTLFDGTLNLKNAAALGAASGTFTINGGTFDNASGSALTTLDYAQAWNGNFTFAGSSDLNLGAGAVALSATRTVTINASTLSVGGDISGAGFGLAKAGAGTLALGGNNTFNGGLTINAGEVIVNNPEALNSASPNVVTMPDDTATKILSLNGNSLTVANLTKNGSTSVATAVVRNNHAVTAATLTVSVPSGAITYGGTITDGGAAPLALRKIGSGTWQVGTGGAGVLDYTGDTTVSGGVLRPGANNIFPYGLGKGNMIVESGATLDFLDRGTISLNGLSGSGTVDKTDPGGAPITTLTVGYNDASAVFTGRVRNTGAGASKPATVNLIKTGTGTQTLSGNNTYTGTTTVSSGTLLVRNPGSPVTVNANATLGAWGTISNSVTVDANGTISAGASAGTLIVTNGLSLGASATNVWELAANDIFNPGGNNFDQITLIGGSLTLDPTSVLAIKFIGTATAPNLADSFWQYPRQWQIIAGDASVANFSVIDGTNGITAGTFTTTADWTGVTLVYTPSVTPPAPTAVTSMNLASVTSTNCALSYSGGTGSQFVLVTSMDVGTPLSFWTPIATNVAFSDSFIIVTDVDPQGFYRIISE